jgi:hypothetical protein
MAELRELVIAGPDPKIHKVTRWRCVDLRAEVTRRFSVTVPERTIGKWLRRLKLTSVAAPAVSSGLLDAFPFATIYEPRLHWPEAAHARRK